MSLFRVFARDLIPGDQLRMSATQPAPGTRQQIDAVTTSETGRPTVRVTCSGHVFLYSPTDEVDIVREPVPNLSEKLTIRASGVLPGDVLRLPSDLVPRGQVELHPIASSTPTPGGKRIRLVSAGGSVYLFPPDTRVDVDRGGSPELSPEELSPTARFQQAERDLTANERRVIELSEAAGYADSARRRLEAAGESDSSPVIVSVRLTELLLSDALRVARDDVERSAAAAARLYAAAAVSS